MKQNTLLTALVCILLCLCNAAICQQNGYRISVAINNLRDTQLIFGHHYLNNMYLDDTIRLNSRGIGEFRGNEKLEKGMYFIFLPNKKYFDILIGDEKIFTIENDTFDFVNRFKSKGSKENQLFYDYQRYFIVKSQQAKVIQDKRKHAITEKERKDVLEQLSLLEREVKDHANNLIKQNSGLFFSTFLRTTIDVDVPDFPRDDQGKVKDSLFQYKYYRAHYFDNFDFTNPDLLRTPVYEGKFKTYFEKIIPQVPDSIMREADMIISRARRDTAVFHYVLETLFNSYAANKANGMDKVFIYIAERYYIYEAEWTSKDFINKVKDQIKVKKLTLIGNTAPNIKLIEVSAKHFAQAERDSLAMKRLFIGSLFNLFDVKAKFIILFFWDADCIQCQKSLLALHEVYERWKDIGVKVIAVHTLGGVEGKKKWIKYINAHNYLDWINAWNTYDMSYKEEYDIQNTPALFLLDEKKQIISKQISPEQAENILNYLLNVGK